MRVKSLVVAALAAAGLVVCSGGAASAATAQCSIVVPSKVTIDQEYRAVPLRLSSNCRAAAVDYASWNFMHATKGWQNIAIFDGATTDTWDLYYWDPVGTYTVRPSSNSTVDFDQVTQNTAKTVVKLGARLTATASRADGKLTLSSTAKTYSPRLSTWAPRPGATVSLMYRASGSSTWTWVKSARSSSSGRVSLSVVPKAGQYRLAIGETPTVWAVSSAAVNGR
jgi:hypothetical protein